MTDHVSIQTVGNLGVSVVGFTTTKLPLPRFSYCWFWHTILVTLLHVLDWTSYTIWNKPSKFVCGFKSEVVWNYVNVKAPNESQKLNGGGTGGVQLSTTIKYKYIPLQWFNTVTKRTRFKAKKKNTRESEVLCRLFQPSTSAFLHLTALA